MTDEIILMKKIMTTIGVAQSKKRTTCRQFILFSPLLERTHFFLSILFVSFFPR